MSWERFIDGGSEIIGEQFFIDRITYKYYYEGDGFEEILDLVNKLYEERMSIGSENTKLKLFFNEVVKDLENHAESGEPTIIQKEYVEWIKDNVDLRLNSEKKDELIKNE